MGTPPLRLSSDLGSPGSTCFTDGGSSRSSRAGPVGEVLDSRVAQLEAELRRVERERDVLKKALIIFGRNE